MPPRTRTTKTLKENAGVNENSKKKITSKNGRPVRKVLADKTNSASDENTSTEVPKKVDRKPTTVSKTKVQSNDENRPRRERRLPSRFANNEVLKNLSGSTSEKAIVTPTKTNDEEDIRSPFKTPQNDTSLLASRPKRVCRLPSKFEDHSISPSKYVPVQPCHASTPISKSLPENKKLRDTSKTGPASHVRVSRNANDSKSKQNKSAETNNNVEDIKPARPRRVAKKTDSRKKTSPPVVVKKALAKKIQSPTKNVQTSLPNGKNNNQTFIKTIPSPRKSQQTPTKKLPTPRKICPRIAKKSPINFSFRILDDRKSDEQNKRSEDIYEFTYDPQEEPAPKKKKKRIVTKRRPAKPKTVTIKNNYDQNLSKTLTALKNAVSKKSAVVSLENTQNSVKSQPAPVRQPIIVEQPLAPKQQPARSQNQNNVLMQHTNTALVPQNESNAQNTVSTNSAINDTVKPQQNINPGVENAASTSQRPNLSIPIEDIAADLDYTPQHEFNYSPTHEQTINMSGQSKLNQSNDPLNIREELSFFDAPIASSSMNVSARHPHASPWRVEFDRLPIKWQANTYVKPNMTPAVECSFVKVDNGQTKHVYTNMVPVTDEPLPDIVQNDQPNMVQTSIISFIKEVVENSAKKKKRERSKTPVGSAIFDDVPSGMSKPAKTLNTPRKSVDRTSVTPSNASDTSNKSENDKENSKNRQKRKNESDENIVPAKTQKKDNSSKENTFFGFDESEDLENVSPKENHNSRALRSRSRAVLKELNEQTGPTRAIIPVSAKTKANLDVVNKLYDGLKSGAEAPNIVEKGSANPEVTTETSENAVADEDAHSVHLFEDIELVHHFKPQRKSYGKAKKVTFRQPSSDSDTQNEGVKEAAGSSSEEDDALDFTFEIPAEEKKKKRTGRKKMTKKQKLSKKEQAEAEAWAAGFNSMCEDVEEFPLVVE